MAYLEHDAVEFLLAAAAAQAVGGDHVRRHDRVHVGHLVLAEAHAAALNQTARRGVGRRQGRR